jgi:hypothetical protein
MFTSLPSKSAWYGGVLGNSSTRHLMLGMCMSTYTERLRRKAEHYCEQVEVKKKYMKHTRI